jgi:hypothetical protein
VVTRDSPLPQVSLCLRFNQRPIVGADGESPAAAPVSAATIFILRELDYMTRPSTKTRLDLEGSGRGYSVPRG